MIKVLEKVVILSLLSNMYSACAIEREPSFQEYFGVQIQLPIKEDDFLDICTRNNIAVTEIGRGQTLPVPAIFDEHGKRVFEEYSNGYLVVGTALLENGGQPQYLLLADDAGQVVHIENRFSYPAP